MAKTEEGKLEEAVESFMNKRRVWQLARYQAASNQFGLPDRLYLYKGYLLGLELKTDTGVPSDLQIRKIKAINENGGIGLIIRKVYQIEELLNIIDAYDEVSKNCSELIKKELYERVQTYEDGRLDV